VKSLFLSYYNFDSIIFVFIKHKLNFFILIYLCFDLNAELICHHQWMRLFFGQVVNSVCFNINSRLIKKPIRFAFDFSYNIFLIIIVKDLIPHCNLKLAFKYYFFTKEIYLFVIYSNSNFKFFKYQESNLI